MPLLVAWEIYWTIPPQIVPNSQKAFVSLSTSAATTDNTNQVWYGITESEQNRFACQFTFNWATLPSLSLEILSLGLGGGCFQPGFCGWRTCEISGSGAGCIKGAIARTPWLIAGRGWAWMTTGLELLMAGWKNNRLLKFTYQIEYFMWQSEKYIFQFYYETLNIRDCLSVVVYLRPFNWRSLMLLWG